MKKIIFLLFAVCCTYAKAQLFTKSYSAVNNYSVSSMGVMQGVPMGAAYIDFYDNHIILWGFGNKYVYKATNPDGSRQYVPVTPTGYPLQEVGVVVSKDFSFFKHIQQMQVMNMTAQMITEYSWIGDGSEPAMEFMNGDNPTNGGYDADIICSDCQGSGVCKYCGGTGRGTASVLCGLCKGTKRCISCKGKGKI